MKDEIKKILRNCEKAINEASGYNDTTDKILDCITNLQEENEELKKNKLTPDELANLLNQELIKQRDDYKSRNEKATEKLESIRTFGLRSGKTLFSTLINETIDILQGEGKDE